jgi:hypothetical protein
MSRQQMKNYSTKENSTHSDLPKELVDHEIYGKRLRSLFQEFSSNAVSNAQLRKDMNDGFVQYKSVKSPPKRTAFIDSEIKKTKKKTQQFIKSKGAANGGAVPTFDFGRNPSEWHSAMLNEDRDIVNRVLGAPTQVQEYMPQQLIVERLRPINVESLKTVAFAEACLAVQKGILLEEKVSLPEGGEVGIHYIAMVTILYDLLRALDNNYTLFSEVTPFYNAFRQSITPRVVKAYSYSWTGVPTIQSLLTPGIPFELDEPGPNHVSLAWLNGTFNSYGQGVLVNTPPVITVNALETVGVEAVTRLWKRVLQQTEGNIVLSEPYMIGRFTTTAAAFALSVDDGVSDYSGYLVYQTEVPIPEHMAWLAALKLVDTNNSSVSSIRAKYIGETYAGTAGYNYRLLNQDFSTKIFNIKPRQVPLSLYLGQVLTMLIQADVVRYDLGTAGVVVQPDDSLLMRLTSGDFLMAIASFVLKRYAMNNFIMLGTDSVNLKTHKLGVGTQFIIDYGAVINGALPLFVTEGMASLIMKPIKTGNRRYDVLVPYIVMTGNKTHADPLNNYDNAEPDSVMELFKALYPNLSPTSDYGFSQVGNAYNVFNIAPNDVAYLYGEAVNTAISNFNLVMDVAQGNFDIGMSLGNIHEEPYTLADYSYWCSPFDPSTPWDDSYTCQIFGMLSIMAFDPNSVSDQLTRIIPVIFGTEVDTYVSMTGESVSLRLDIPLYTQIGVNACAGVHAIAGMGNETSLADRSVTYRGGGGGIMDFLKQSGKVAIPAISALLSGVANAYLPGSGGVIRGIGDGLAGLLRDVPHIEDSFVRGLSKKGYEKPYATIFRPISSVRTTGSSMVHITKKVDYY